MSEIYPEISPRQVQLGKQCNLLTGSYRGKTRGCSCYGPSGCFLSQVTRATLAKHPVIIERVKRNWVEFDQFVTAERNVEELHGCF